MGLIKALFSAAGGVLADQWLDFFVCESMPADVLVSKGQRRLGRRGSNSRGEDNVISNGSGLVVNQGQAAIIVDEGRVAEFCAEEGSYTWDKSSEPSVFSGDEALTEKIKTALKNMGERFKYGGSAAKDQRIYFFNTKEILGNKYGTPSPVPFLVTDPSVNLRLTISLRCSGEYSFKLVNPVLFYANVSGNVESDYTRDNIESQLKTEILTALGPAFGRLGKAGIEYHEIIYHTAELAAILNEELSARWRESRGIEIVNFGINTLSAPKEDEDRIKQMQQAAALRDPRMAAAVLANAQSDAMRGAAANPNGAAAAFMGMGMAQGAGGDVQGLFAMGGANGAPGASGPGNGGASGSPGGSSGGASSAWDCPCGKTGNSGKFCVECGRARPESSGGWVCSCGQRNGGRFCANCGKPKPAGEALYRCDKCGWEPPDPRHPPKFCANCGDAFNEKDITG